jgi:hypothetical protein|nr:MAG: hypothetical protein [Microviridae sp.]
MIKILAGWSETNKGMPKIVIMMSENGKFYFGDIYLN